MASASQLRHLVDHPPTDENERRALYKAARALYISLERPIDAMHRLFWSVEQLPLVQMGIDLGVFRTMAAEPEKKWTLTELAERSRAEETLLYRVMRYLASFGLLQENRDSTYSATSTTQWLATEGAEGGVKHYQRTIAPICAALPEVLKQQQYRNPTDPADTAFQVAHHTDKVAYSWVPSDPSVIAAFMAFMKSQREGQKAWTDTFPMVMLELSEPDLNDGRPMFVDVGGSSGQQCIALRQQLPGSKGGIVLQDQEMVIAKVDKEQLAGYGIEAQAHDFFKQQPVKSAKAYYMRNIMHDWPDDKCADILTRLREACADDSMLLIDEMVLPDTGASWKQAQKDIQMMAGLAAMERSESQWRDVLARAGLKIRQVCTYDKEMGDSVIIAVKA